MVHYKLEDNSIQIAQQITQNIKFLGSETFKILELFKALNDDSKKPYYAIEEDLVKFFLNKINETTFIGSSAVAVSKVIISLNKPIKELPTSSPMPAPPAPLTAPKGSPSSEKPVATPSDQ